MNGKVRTLIPVVANVRKTNQKPCSLFESRATRGNHIPKQNHNVNQMRVAVSRYGWSDVQ
jgi:hypothetical protein